LDNVYLFSDENGQHTSGRYFIVAGVAFTKYRTWIATEIQQAERASGKEKRDWKEAKNVAQRVDYLNRIFTIKNLVGTVFYAACENHKKEYWDYTVDALALAIERFSPKGNAIVRHQGFDAKTREKLEEELKRRECSCEIQSGDTT
jgi:hypothetical protein